MSQSAANQALTMEQLRRAIASIISLPPNDIADDANLLELGLDSLGIMRLVNIWRKEGIRVSSRELAAEPTVAAWQRHIDALRAAAEAERMLPDAARVSARRETSGRFPSPGAATGNCPARC